MSYTKGPWKTFSRMGLIHITNPEESAVEIAHIHVDRLTHDNEANARLIAAAPEMYELLTRMHPLLVAFRDDYDRIGLERVLAVIKQVKGE